MLSVVLPPHPKTTGAIELGRGMVAPAGRYAKLRPLEPDHPYEWTVVKMKTKLFGASGWRWLLCGWALSLALGGASAMAGEADLAIPDLHAAKFFGGRVSGFDLMLYGSFVIAGTLGIKIQGNIRNLFAIQHLCKILPAAPKSTDDHVAI